MLTVDRERVRYPGWVTELNDPEKMQQVDGSAHGLDNLLYSADACAPYRNFQAGRACRRTSQQAADVSCPHAHRHSPCLAIKVELQQPRLLKHILLLLTRESEACMCGCSLQLLCRPGACVAPGLQAGGAGQSAAVRAHAC